MMLQNLNGNLLPNPTVRLSTLLVRLKATAKKTTKNPKLLNAFFKSLNKALDMAASFVSTILL